MKFLLRKFSSRILGEISVGYEFYALMSVRRYPEAKRDWSTSRNWGNMPCHTLASAGFSWSALMFLCESKPATSGCFWKAAAVAIAGRLRRALK
jgi:hypothetical protein